MEERGQRDKGIGGKWSNEASLYTIGRSEHCSMERGEYGQADGGDGQTDGQGDRYRPAPAAASTPATSWLRVTRGICLSSTSTVSKSS